MRISTLLTFVLALFVSCQGTRQEHSDLSQAITEVYNPSILALQFMTLKIKREKGKWPESSSEYVNVFGDSAKVVLADFDKLSFDHSSDTLKINYTLKEPGKRPVIEFVNLEPSGDSLGFNGSVQQNKARNRFKVNEGMLTIFNSHELSIIRHEYSDGAVLNKITHAAQ